MTQPPLDLLREARNLTSLLVIVLAGPDADTRFAKWRLERRRR